MPAAIRGAFYYTKINGDLPVSCFLAYCVKIALFNRHGLADVVRIEFFLQFGFEFCTVSAFNPKWIARQQSFAEGNQIAAFCSGLVHPVDDFRECRLALQPDWRDLRQSDY